MGAWKRAYADYSLTNIVYSGNAHSGVGYVRASCIRAAVINAEIPGNCRTMWRNLHSESARMLHAQINRRYGNQTVKIYHTNLWARKFSYADVWLCLPWLAIYENRSAAHSQTPERLSRVRLNSNWFRIHGWMLGQESRVYRIRQYLFRFDTLHIWPPVKMCHPSVASASMQLNSRICFSLIRDFVLNERIHCLRLPHTRSA